ncbi:MAG: ADOP family duplicated permease [Gemmatimonadaceae bacterium]
MNWTSGWGRYFRFWTSDRATGIDDELRFHLEQKVEDFLAQGMSPDAARKRAEAEFGDLHSVRETLNAIDERIVQKQRRAEWWESIAQDLKYVLRSLRRSPVFTATVVVTLALGLGANAALFSLLDQLYVQTPAGLTDAAHLRRVYQFMPNKDRPFTRTGLSYPEIRELRAVSAHGISFAGYSAQRTRIGRAFDSPEIGVTYVEGDYFGIAGVHPEVGRFFSSDENRISGISMVVVISHAMWIRQFNRDPSIIGREIDLGSHRHVVIGVTPDGFRGVDLDASDAWVPLNTTGTLKGRKPDWFETTNFNGIKILARVPDERSAKLFDARATEALHHVRLGNDSTGTRTFMASIIEARGGESLSNELAMSTRLAGVAAVILLIACANVVNLLLARGASRQREIAVRLALGVSRRRLISQLMLESAVLALLSSVVAVFVAYVAATTLRTSLLPTVHWSNGAINSRVALFTVALALIAGFAAGLAPALQSSRADLSSALKSGVRDGGQRKSKLRTTLLITQAALSIVLLVGAGVFVRSLQSVESIDTGYDTNRLFYATVSYDRELENREKEIEARIPEAAARIRNIPGVEKVALAENIPMWAISFSSLFLPGRDSLPPATGRGRFSSVVSPDYFATVGMRILRGRDFNEADSETSEPVIVVDENLAKNLWPNEDALTKCLIVEKRELPCRRVIGVVSTSHFANVIEDASSHFFLPLAQNPESGPGVVVVRTAPGRGRRIGALAVRELSQMFGDWSRVRSRTMDEIQARDMKPWRVGAALFTAAGLLALLVAAVGVYSSIAYTVSQRTQEMGVRVALGASAGNIMSLVVSEGVRVVAIGIGLGLLAALALGSVVASLLYQTSPRDPYVIVVSSMTLLVVAVVACSIPAWRASRVNPLEAMRTE